MSGNDDETLLREIPCQVCNGDGEFEIVVGRGGWDGPLTEYRKCSACDGKGHFIAEVEPINIEDLDHDDH